MIFPQLAVRVSDYNIYVESPETNQWVVAHGYTGATDRVEAQTVAWLKSGMEGETVPPETRSFLLSRGYLTTRSPEEEQAIVRSALQKHRALSSKGVGFTVVLSYDCNFRCTYCIQRVTQLKGKAYIKQGMSDEVMDSAFRFMESYAGSDSHITLYGGEPFGDGNQRRVRRFLDWVRAKKRKIKCISNGYDWELFQDDLDPEIIERVQVTIDGPPEIHNRKRIALGTKDSFWTIIKNIKWALERGLTILLRINCDRTNLPSLESLTHLFVEQGLYGFDGRFLAYLAPVHDNGVMKDHTPLFGAGEMYKSVLDAHDHSCGGSCGCHDDDGAGAESGGEGVLFNTDYLPILRHDLKRALEGERLPYKMTFCGAYTNLYVLDPFGRLYGCWDVADDPDHVMGMYHPNFELFDKEVALWRGRIDEVLTKQCISCPHVLLHGSGCQAEAFRRTGNFLERDCQEFPEQFDFAMKCAMGAARVGDKPIPTV